jgi:hypothetical protein
MGKTDLLKKSLNLCPLCKEDITWRISGFRNKDVMRCPACHAEWKFRWITQDVLCMGLKQVGFSDFVKKYDLQGLLIGDKRRGENKFQLSTFWSTYKALKEADETRIHEFTQAELTNYLASYLGGDTNLLKSFIFRQVGTLRVTKNDIAFIEAVGNGAPSYVAAVETPLLEIPLRTIDLTHFRLTTPLTHPSSSSTNSTVVLIIPYLDKGGSHQQPLFQLELALTHDNSQAKLNQFYKTLYLAILHTRQPEKNPP